MKILSCTTMCDFLNWLLKKIAAEPSTQGKEYAMEPVIVYVIESLSAADNLAGRSESVPVSAALRAMGFGVQNYSVFEAEDLVGSLKKIGEHLQKRTEDNEKVLPIIHFSCHGQEHLMNLTNGFIEWDQLAQLLIPVNRYCEGQLIVAMSTCYGYTSAYDMGSDRGEPPYKALVGPKGTPEWMDTLMGFSIFYYLLAQIRDGKKKISIKEIVSRMNAVTQIEFDFHLWSTRLNAFSLVYRKLDLDSKKFEAMLSAFKTVLKKKAAPSAAPLS